MRRIILVIVALVTVPLFAAEQMGFAKANQPAAASYSPDPADSFNSTGGAITVKRVGVGLYAITFAGLAKNLKRSNAQLSDIGSGSEQCSLRSWGRAVNTDNLVVSIQCISNTTGVNVDAKWSVLAMVIE